MAYHFEIADEEYIEEVKDKSDNETMKEDQETDRVLEERFQKVGE